MPTDQKPPAPIVFDLETAPLPDAERYLEPVVADKRLTHPDKIAADVAKKEAARMESVGLDWNLCRIVALGWKIDGETTVSICRTETDEMEAIKEFHRVRRSDRRTLVGFYARQFDAPVLMQRARYLDVPCQPISLKRWGNDDLIDLYDLLTFDDVRCSWAMRRTLDMFCTRFGLDVPDDPLTGADIASLVAAGDWEGVASHCRSDVEKTSVLARRLRVREQS